MSVDPEGRLDFHDQFGEIRSIRGVEFIVNIFRGDRFGRRCVMGNHYQLVVVR